MSVFRWTAGTLIASFAVAGLLAHLVAAGFDAPVWAARARRLRHGAWLTVLLWFNVEVWGRVVAGLVRP